MRGGHAIACVETSIASRSGCTCDGSRDVPSLSSCARVHDDRGGRERGWLPGFCAQADERVSALSLVRRPALSTR